MGRVLVWEWVVVFVGSKDRIVGRKILVREEVEVRVGNEK